MNNTIIRNFLKLSHDVRTLTGWMDTTIQPLDDLRTGKMSIEEFNNWVRQTYPSSTMVFLDISTDDLLSDNEEVLNEE